MANIKIGTGEYLRVVFKDSGHIDLFRKQFYAEVSRNKSMRDNKEKYDQAEWVRFNFADRWNLTIDGDTTVNQIIGEIYRCISLEPGFRLEDGWVSDEA